MIVKPSDTVAVQFTTQNPITGAAANADSLPVGVLVRNGDDTAETVTVSNIATGVYKASVTIPAGYSAGDEVQLRIAATVAAVAGKAVIWAGEVDTARESETYARIGAPAGASVSADIASLDSDGNGSATYVATITDANSVPLDGVQVWATTDVGGSNIVASGVTNSHGQITFALDPANYYLWRQRAGQNFTNPVGFTVT